MFPYDQSPDHRTGRLTSETDLDIARVKEEAQWEDIRALSPSAYDMLKRADKNKKMMSDEQYNFAFLLLLIGILSRMVRYTLTVLSRVAVLAPKKIRAYLRSQRAPRSES